MAKFSPSKSVQRARANLRLLPLLLLAALYPPPLGRWPQHGDVLKVLQPWVGSRLQVLSPPGGLEGEVGRWDRLGAAAAGREVWRGLWWLRPGFSGRAGCPGGWRSPGGI